MEQLLRPRYQPGSRRRPFVDREHAVRVFGDIMSALRLQNGHAPATVLSLTGVGGIGKSRLLSEFANQVRGDHPLAMLDLQVPSQRQQENALATMRAQFGGEHVAFPRFDIAYAVWWQRLHPNLRISREALPLVEHSEVLTEIIGEASGVPVFGAGLRLVDWATRRLRKWHWMRNDQTLQELDTLSIVDLADAVTYLFATELAASSRDGVPFVLFVDAYEALVGGTRRVGIAASQDSWLRDLVSQLTDGLVVIASREPLDWHRHHPDWAERIVHEHIEDLPMDSRVELLSTSGMQDDRVVRAVATASAGMPFYLHLAIDAGAGTSARPDESSSFVSADAILERFCAHVDSEHVRLLELLNVARVFDEEIFHRIAASYGLPGDRLMWQALTGYSFVYTFGERVQLHQLMVQALRRRLEPSVAVGLHRLMRRVWDDRATTAVGATAASAALREAAFHALRAGDVLAPGLLWYADRILTRGVQADVDGLRRDIQEFLTESTVPRPELDVLVRLMMAEAAILRGDAALAAATIGDPPTEYDDDLTARLAVTAGHAFRILGRTASALSIYHAVWTAGNGPPAIAAGLWAADLHMCQGRTAQAVELADQLERITADDDPETHAHIARLLALTYRFAFEFRRGAEHLAHAKQQYALADSEVGLANVAVNEAEIFAHLDPPAGITAAERAIELQRALGAVHELGKAYTALAVARLRLGDTAGARVALDEACELLDSVGYRSGRARAELIRGIMSARDGQLDEAVSAAEWAVDELEASEVYPTVVMIAGHLIDWIDRPSDRIHAAAERARASLTYTADEIADLDDRLAATLSAMLGATAIPPMMLYRLALARSSGATGFYNRNVAIDTPAGRLLVRIPLRGADLMDLRIWPEADVVAAIGPYVRTAAALRHRSASPVFQIQEFIEGESLDHRAPRGVPVPDHVIPEVVGFFVELASVPFNALPDLPTDWPQDGDTAAFARLLVNVTREVHRTHQEQFQRLFADLGIPADPTEAVEAGLASLRSRSFRLVHADVHRKNVILSDSGCRFIDWELALWADPVYDVAAHIHKMGYLDDERQRFIERWAEALGEENDGWSTDLDTYLRHERVKSAVVDTIRYAKLRSSDVKAKGVTEKLTSKLNLAHEIWGVPLHVTDDEVRSALSRWAAG
jgi:hypothetical protein